MESKLTKTETQKPKIAIVGGGLAGLSAAASLMDRADVTIFEKSKTLGGRASTAHKEGFDINQGPHALYVGGAAYKLFAELGLTPAGGPPDVTGSKGYRKKQLFALPTGFSSLVKTGMLSLSEKWQLAMLFQKLAKVDAASLQTISVRQWLEEQTKSFAVINVIEAFSRLSTYCNSPEKMSAGAAFAQMALANKGVLYLDNGWETLVKTLTEEISGRVKINTGEKIKELPSRELFDAIILAIPPDAVSELLKQFSTNIFAQDLNQLDKIQATRAACLDLCLKKLPDASVTFALGIDKPLYFSVHSASAKLTPGQGVLVHVAYYLEAGQAGTDSHRIRLEEYLDCIQNGWRDQVIYQRFMPNMVASYGCATAANDGYQGLTGSQLKGAENIYVCGDFVGRGHMLVDAAVSSALEAASLVMRKNC